MPLFSFVLCSGLFLFFCFSPLPCFCSAPLFFFLFSAFFFFFFSVSALLFFCFSVSAPLFLVFCFSLFLSFVQHHFSCFFRRVALFFQPKTILSSAQKHFFQAETFLLQPKTFFSSTHTTVSASFSFCWFCFQRLLFFFLFQRLILFFLPTSKAKNILLRCFTFLLFE